MLSGGKTGEVVARVVSIGTLSRLIAEPTAWVLSGEKNVLLQGACEEKRQRLGRLAKGIWGGGVRSLILTAIKHISESHFLARLLCQQPS